MPQLANHLSASDADPAARVLDLPSIELPPGAVELHGVAASHPGTRGPVTGVVVAAGVLTAETRLDDRTSALLFLPGDVVPFDGDDTDTLPSRTTWRVSSEAASVVALDDRFLAACQRWPRLVGGLLARLAVQARRTKRSQAISQLPRVEDRVLGLLWAIADTHGHVHPDGVHVEIALTHAAIGDLVGSRRPTVSLGLQALERAGLLRHDAGEWIVAQRSLARFEHLSDAVRPPDDDVLVVCAARDARAVGTVLADAVPVDHATALDVLASRAPRVVVLVAGDAAAEAAVVARLRERTARDRPRLVAVQLGSTRPAPPTLASAQALVVGTASTVGLADRVRAAQDGTSSTFAQPPARASNAS